MNTQPTSLLSRTSVRRFLRISLVTTPLVALLILVLIITHDYGWEFGPQNFVQAIPYYGLAGAPWFLAAPFAVLIGFNQTAERRGIMKIVVEGIFLGACIAAFHLINLTFVYSPFYGISIYQLLPSIHIRDTVWDFLIFVLALMSGHIMGAVHRSRQTAAQDSNSQKILARSASRVDIVEVTDIIAASAQGNYVALITEQGEFLHRTTLAEMKQALAGHGFVQVHRSHLVRTDSIASVTRSDGRIRKISMRSGRQFPVSAGKQDMVASILETAAIAA